MLPGRHKKKSQPACVRSALPKKRRRYKIVRFEDGSERAVRCQSLEHSCRQQACADFYGIAPGLSARANIRSMNSLLSEIVESWHLEDKKIAPEVLADAWRKAVGAFLAQQAELVSISQETARIRTSHPAVRFELTRLRPQIIHALNATLGEGCVLRIQIVHG